MAQEPIFGAGGIVVRSGDRPLIAVVQRRKDDEWVLPKGKLKREESALAAAEREVKEETGQDVVVHEFLGAISYRVGRRPKVVQFWRMQACDRPARKPTKDIKAVKWLPLNSAIRKLSDPLEQIFLQNIAERSLMIAAPPGEQSAPGEAKQPLLRVERPTALTLPISDRSIAAEPPVREESPALPVVTATGSMPNPPIVPTPAPRPVAIEKSASTISPIPIGAGLRPVAMKSEGPSTTNPAVARSNPGPKPPAQPVPVATSLSVLGARPAPPLATNEAAAVSKRGVALPSIPEPVARLNPFGRILHRLWRDGPALSQLLRWTHGKARRSGR